MANTPTQLIKSEAERLGFMSCGISEAGFLEAEAPRLERWLNKNMHGQMGYMANHFDKRLDPRLLVDDARSVISLTLNYFPEKEANSDSYKISKYAYGEDYHFVIKRKLKDLIYFIEENIGEVNARGFVDSAPVLDKAWAAKSGLGWIGKNANLITPQVGSFFFVAELITDMELESDGPITDHCGTCTACLDACPTEAIVEPYVVDGSKCISYLTIELKDAIPSDVKGKFDDWMFGCDVCQDVCPWNRFSKPHSTEEFDPRAEIIDFTKAEWDQLEKETFQKVFKGSAVKRTKFEGLKRNIEFLKKP